MSSSIAPLWNASLWNATLFGGGAAPSGVAPISVGQGLLYPALRKAGITLGPQRTPSPAQFQDSIDELNRLTASLNCDRLFIYSRATLTFPLTGAKAYTIGHDPTGATLADFDAPRPQAIESANLIAAGAPALRYPLAIATDLQWANIRLQNIPDTIPEVVYNDRGYPLSTLYLWGQPIPGQNLELFAWNLVPQFAGLADVVLLPPGYEDAVVLNLACRLAPHFQRQIDPQVLGQARESLMRLESINAPRPIADTSALCSGRGNSNYNIYSDQFRR